MRETLEKVLGCKRTTVSSLFMEGRIKKLTVASNGVKESAMIRKSNSKRWFSYVISSHIYRRLV